MRIVLAEDDECLNEAMVERFKSLGHEVSSFFDGLAAKEFIMSNLNSIDLVITDHNMPKMTGLELAKALGAALDGTVQKFKIVCFSTDVENKGFERHYFNRTFAKTPEELLHYVNELTEERK
jgi:DNA-binding response OmpR family regulator